MHLDKTAVFGAIEYVPHEHQKIMHDALETCRYFALAGGSRGGKSMACGAEIAQTLLLPKKQVWCVSSIYDLADKEFQWAVEFLSRFQLGKTSVLNHPLTRVTSSARGSKKIVLPWGSWCCTKSWEKPVTLLGDELDLLVVGEAAHIPRKIWERYLRARISSRHGKAIFASTPCDDGGFFKEVYEKGKVGEKDYASHSFATLDNPHANRADVEKAKTEMAEEVFREQFGGEFVARRGSVFALCAAVTPTEFPDLETQPRICVWYHHQNAYNNPFVCLIFAYEAESKTLYLTSEYHKDKVNPLDAVNEVKSRTAGTRVAFHLVDGHNKILQELLRGQGIAAVWDRDECKLDKTQYIVKRLQTLQSACQDRGEIKLRIAPPCVASLDELKNLKWRERTQEEKEQAEPALPSDKYISVALCISQAVVYLKRNLLGVK